jgi:diamine N-acetyltransferase
VQIQGKKIILRTVLPSDADILYKWENDRSNWDVSGTKKPFTKKEIKDFIENQKDIYLDKQLRLMICTPAPRLPLSSIQKKRRNEESENRSIGCIDLFEFDKKKAGVGILIDKKYRNKGYASEALSLLIQYSFYTLNLKELFCHISESNLHSMKLFKKHKFGITENKKGVCLLQVTYK